MKTCRSILLLVSVAVAAYGQTAPPAANLTAAYNFSDGNLHQIGQGTLISFPAVDINATATAVITIANTGNAAGTWSSFVVNGDGFQVVGLPLLPATVPAGQGLRFGIAFTPPKAGSFNGSYLIEMGGRTISGTLTGLTAPPNLSLSYVDPRTNSVIALSDGATLPFPDTPVGSASTINLQVPNTGTGTGEIRAVTLGDNFNGVFELLNLTPVPISVPPSFQFRFAIRFTALDPKPFATTLALNLNGQTVTVNLAARATGPRYRYTYAADRSVSAGGTIAVPDTQIGQTASLTITVMNEGSANGQINGISATGQAFTVSDLPLFPMTLRPNETQQFTLNFTPTQPGVITGRLIVGGELILLTGNGVGPRLTYTYTNSGTATSVVETGTVFLPPATVSATQKVNFTIQNTGTGAATLSSITASGSATTFVLEGVPGLPTSLEPGKSVSFAIAFTPTTTGALTGILRVNTSSFALSGTGTEPAALPKFQLTTSTPNPKPADQAAVGLTLSAPYVLPMEGTVTLSFVSDVFTDDPAIQFASGGRTVKFTIPANTTQALFNTVSPTIPIQTGTTAGTIILTPSFGLQGGYDLTPPSPAPLSIKIPRAVPQLVSGAVTDETLNSFLVTITGYATTRNLKQLDVQFTPKSGQSFTTTRLTLDVTQAATAWFQSAASQQVGGGFQFSIPFSLQNGNSTDDLVHRLDSLSITAINDAGTSTAIVVPVP